METILDHCVRGFPVVPVKRDLLRIESAAGCADFQLSEQGWIERYDECGGGFGVGDAFGEHVPNLFCEVHSLS